MRFQVKIWKIENFLFFLYTAIKSTESGTFYTKIYSNSIVAVIERQITNMYR